MCTPTLCAKLAQTSGQEAYYPGTLYIYCIEREKRYTFFPFPVLLAPINRNRGRAQSEVRGALDGWKVTF